MGLIKWSKEEVRCNNCMTVYPNDEALALLQDEEGEFRGCKNCGTDEFLMEHFQMDVADDEIVFVNVYTVRRKYGGPEEGGWWFNWYECVEVIPVQNQYSEQMREILYEKYINSELKYGDIYSVLGGQDIAVYIEEHPKQSETRERPVYE